MKFLMRLRNRIVSSVVFVTYDPDFKRANGDRKHRKPFWKSRFVVASHLRVGEWQSDEVDEIYGPMLK